MHIVMRRILSKMGKNSQSFYLAGGKSCAMLVLCGVIAAERASGVKRPPASIKAVALKGKPCLQGDVPVQNVLVA